MGDHVFISYQHGADAHYVDQLARHLQAAGIPVWYDRELIVGDRWIQVIRQHVDDCRALIVVMTPEAEQSRWVNLEVQRAEDKGKPIFPVLRSGTPFFQLGDTQYEDVTDGRAPSAVFLAKLKAQPATGHTNHRQDLTLHYRISRPPSLASSRRVHIEVTASRDCDGVDFVVVVSLGRIMPLEPADGEAVHRFTQLGLRGGVPKKLHIPALSGASRPYWIRCFADAPPDVWVEDPAVDEMFLK